MAVEGIMQGMTNGISPSRARRRTIAIAIEKGGVGKTTITATLGVVIANHFNLRVLLLDFDPQRNLTIACLGAGHQPGRTVVDVCMGRASLADVLVPAVDLHPNVLVAPGSQDLANIERRVDWEQSAIGIVSALRKSIPPDIDLVLIDTPPGKNLWLRTALSGADYYLVVGEPEMLCALGTLDVHATARSVPNPHLTFLGLVVNKVDVRLNEHSATIAWYRNKYPKAIIEPFVPMRAAIKESVRTRRYLELLNTDSYLGEVFYQVAETVLRRMGVGQPVPVLA